MESSIGKRVWDVVRTLCYMSRKVISKRKLMLDLHLLLRRGKTAGKAASNLMSFHYQHKTTAAASVSRRNMDPNLAYYNPYEIEFSCSNTPVMPKRSAKNRRRRENEYYNLDAEAVKRVFEILNSTTDKSSDADETIVASPSPAPLWMLGLSPAVPVRKVRITDSPFPIKEEEGEAEGGRVDRAAEEFIKRFYEQLRQQIAVATPEYGFHGQRDRRC